MNLDTFLQTVEKSRPADWHRMEDVAVLKSDIDISILWLPTILGPFDKPLPES